MFDDIYEPIYDYVRTVPAGKVVTYGQVAGCVQGISVTARQVGAAMQFTPDNVPWQRVVGAGGHLPIGKRSPELRERQIRLLEDEGVEFLPGEAGRVNMHRSQWRAGLPEEQGDLFEL